MTGSRAHPLRPLDAEEMTAACEVVREAYATHVPGAAGVADLRFPVVALTEPDRDALRRWEAGAALPRQADVVAIERVSGLVSEVVVDLAAGAVERWSGVPGARPVLLFDESIMAIDAVKHDGRWLAAMGARGITDVGEVQVDPWPAGNFSLPGEAGRRLLRCVAYVREDFTDNGYAHPVEGLVAVVDSATYEVIDVVDTGIVPVPAGSGRYGPGDAGAPRAGVRPIDITQPEGPSFELDGNEIRWLGWRLRFTVHPVEGLVLHTVSYEQGGRVRPILHRASVAEMVVPYGATGASHWWKNAFDAGEWGLGRMIQPLALGCDCLGEIRYADAVLPDDAGGARVVANAVCVHEEDHGILWKHVDLWSGSDEVRRSRRLVVSVIATVGNYEYGFYWRFYLDGTIELEVKLTGILQTGACDPTVTIAPDHGTMLAPGLWAPTHQHLFCARLDMEVDGPANSVEEVDVVAVGLGPGNERGNAIDTEVTLLEREADAQRLADPARSRRWRVVNRGSRNGVGQPVGYALYPASPVTLLAHPDSSVAKRATFATKNLWVTPWRADERRPAGDHPNQHAGGDGLPAWTAANRPIVDTTLVVWHTFGVSHVARPEDWPVMPVESAGFSLRPAGFFDRNPALDLAPSGGHCAPATSPAPGGTT